MTKHGKHTASGQARFGRALAFVAAAAAVLALGASDAGAAARASKNSPGPVLTTPASELAAALSCPQAVRGKRPPVLLVPGAGGDPGLAFSAGLEPVLRANRFAVCIVALPDAAMSDNQRIAEYLVSSIRRVSARSGRPVSVVV
jgi:hypothetical protein